MIRPKLPLHLLSSVYAFKSITMSRSQFQLLTTITQRASVTGTAAERAPKYIATISVTICTENHTKLAIESSDSANTKSNHTHEHSVISLPLGWGGVFYLILKIGDVCLVGVCHTHIVRATSVYGSVHVSLLVVFGSLYTRAIGCSIKSTSHI